MSFFSGRKPKGLGVKNGKLAPCPKTPNCVSSMEKPGGSMVDPLEYEGDKEKAFQRLIKVIERQKGARITKSSGDYIHAEFESSFFGFVDDVEFFFPEEGGRVEVRSASRMGYWDHGVNRARVEEIRNEFEEK